MTTNEWSFMEHQYDIVETQGQNVGENYANQNVVSLFGWGTSGYNHGAVCYQPWCTSSTNSDYWVYGLSYYNLYNGNGQADWGYNAIANGGNTENSGWRTLTQPEWHYIFINRNTTSDIRYAKATVNGVNGIILLPDNWAASTYALNSTNIGYANFTTNTITAEDWANTLEANGAVFLPTAGWRDGTLPDHVGFQGFYWSSSYKSSDFVYYVSFHRESLLMDYDNSRCLGLSVRLVRNVE